MVLSNETNGSKLGALMRREADVREAKAALRAAKAKQRQLSRRTAAEINSLLGAAVTADLETATDENRAAQRAYITEVLARTYRKKSAARALLEANGWL